MKQRKKQIVGLGALGAALLIMFTTSPKNVPVWVLLLPICFLFIALLTGVYALLGVFPSFRANPGPRRRIYSVVLAGVPALLLLLQSVNQLTIKDVLLFCAFLFVFGFYVSRFNLHSPKRDLT